MTAAVIPFASATAADEAWERYRAHKRKEFDDPKLGLDRAHMEESARLHDAWLRLFLAGERAAKVVPIDGGRG